MNTKLDHPALLLISRFYDSEKDLQQMLDMLKEARACTNDWRYAHVGELLFNFLMVACHLDPMKHIRLWNDGNKLVGFAILAEDPSFDFQALPEYEWRGIKTEALSWAETLVAELRKQDAQRWGGPIVSGARQDNLERIAFLEQCGFRQDGEFSEVNTLCSLDEPIPEFVIPAGCQVRVVDEASVIPDRAAAHREVWQPWTDANVSDGDYAYFMRLPGYHRNLDIVAIAPDGAIAAYVNGWIDPVNRVDDFGQVGAPGLPPARFDACGSARRFAPDEGARDEPCERFYRRFEHACNTTL
jgi:hypothetical protein